MLPRSLLSNLSSHLSFLLPSLLSSYLCLLLKIEVPRIHTTSQHNRECDLRVCEVWARVHVASLTLVRTQQMRSTHANKQRKCMCGTGANLQHETKIRGKQQNNAELNMLDGVSMKVKDFVLSIDSRQLEDQSHTHLARCCPATTKEITRMWMRFDTGSGGEWSRKTKK